MQEAEATAADAFPPYRDVPRDSNEFASGMEVFYTGTPPLGGRLRRFPEDFVVEEIGAPPRPDENGRHVAFRVRLTNWEHNHFIRDATRRMGIGRKMVGFSGTKDKRAVTTQWFTFMGDRRSEAELLESLQGLPRVEVLEHHRTKKGLRLGMHDANRFRIVVRDIEGPIDAVQSRLDATLGALHQIGGFPNFFGIQRFGAVRPITHLVGEAIVQGDLEEACIRYVAAAAPEESGEAADARARIRENRDWKEAVRILPTSLKFELAVAQSLSRDPTDFVAALRQLPTNLVLLFVHAYQSYLFNRMLSERIRRGLPLHEPVEGDLVLVRAGDAMVDVAPVPVHADNLAKVRQQVARGRAVVSLPLVGTDTPMATGEPGAIERQVLDEEGVRPERFSNRWMPEASSRGLRRALLAPVGELAATVDEDPAHEGRIAATVGFVLPKGSYATTLLREVLKADDTSIY